jgi:hypothetical protein
MNDAVEKAEQELGWVKTLVSDKVTLVGYGALALFVGHRSFGLPDFGIAAWHLFAIGVVGAILIGIATFVVGRRADGRMIRGLQDNGFTDDEIESITSIRR